MDGTLQITFLVSPCTALIRNCSGTFDPVARSWDQIVWEAIAELIYKRG